MKKVLLIGLLSLSLNVMAGVPLLDLVAKGGAQLLEVVVKKGFKKAEQNSLELAFRSLTRTKEGMIPTSGDVNKALNAIHPSIEFSDDTARVARVRNTLSKSPDEVTEAEMRALVDDSSTLSHRYGDGRGTTCGGDCGVGTAKLYTEASALLKKFTANLPPNPADTRKSIHKLITKLAKDQKLVVGDISTATIEKKLAKEDENFVHVILDMALNGTKEEKEFAKSLLELSRHGKGPINIFDDEFPNRLYRVLTDKDLGAKMSQYTEFFKRVDAHVTEPMSARDKLVKYMEDIVAKMDDSNADKVKLKEAYEDFINANCFK
jgi:hypothetical protein